MPEVASSELCSASPDGSRKEVEQIESICGDLCYQT